MEKGRRYYLDTSIWLDFFEDRDEPNFPKSSLAKELIKNIVKDEGIIFYSDLHIKELKSTGYDYNKIIEMFGMVRGNIRKIHTFKGEKELAKKIAIQRNVPKADALHAILARNNEAQLVSRDEHFERLRGVTIAKKPEELT